MSSTDLSLLLTASDQQECRSAERAVREREVGPWPRGRVQRGGCRDA